MAQIFTASRISQAGVPGPTNKKSSAFGLSGCVVLSCTGPASSVQAGMTLDVSSWLPSKCYGGYISRTAGEDADIAYYCKPTATTFASATFKLVAVRISAGAKLSSGVSLTSEKLLATLWGC